MRREPSNEAVLAGWCLVLLCLAAAAWLAQVVR